MRSLVAAAALALSLVVVPTAAAAPPTITYSIDGIAGMNGWYRGSVHGNNVVLHWVVTGATGIDPSCLTIETIPGPTTGTTRSCTAWNADGSTTRVTNPPIKIDATPPTGVGLRMARAPDHSGWYNHAVAVTWSGRDATSGIATCSSLNYAGPDGVGVVVRGRCVDKAGNAIYTGIAINYDATPPALSGVSVGSTAKANVVRWASSSPADKIVVRRTARANTRHVLVFQGSASRFADKRVQPGVEYLYTLRAFDQAGNASGEVTTVGRPKVLTLQKMPYVPRAAPKPILQWGAVPRATYYNVQLFRGRKRILAAWPQTHRFAVPAAWKWDGRSFRLGPGHYHWYVWAGFGLRSFADYRTVGSAQFIVPRSKR
jgi:hypothetical protein